MIILELHKKLHTPAGKEWGQSSKRGREDEKQNSMERIIREVQADCNLASRAWGIHAYVVIELTHVPVSEIATLARKAIRLEGVS